LDGISLEDLSAVVVARCMGSVSVEDCARAVPASNAKAASVAPSAVSNSFLLLFTLGSRRKRVAVMGNEKQLEKKKDVCVP
jgi:hypothetical protein